MNKLITYVSFAALIFSLAACGGAKKEQENTLSGDIKIDGSSTVFPITEAIAEEFRTEAPNVKVTVGVSGTGGGFKKFGRGELDIANASRPIKEKEDSACKAANIAHVGLTIAYDGLAVIINPANTWVDYLTVEELKKIWEPAAEGKIMYWSDIRKGWPKEKLNLFGPDAASGTYDYFVEEVCGKDVGSRGDYTNSSDDNVLVQGVAGDKYALGFFGLAYFENATKLKLVGVDNGNGPIIPSMETVLNKTYAPLSRPIFIYLSSQGAKKKEVVAFVDFYLETVKAISKDVGYIPLTDQEYAVEKDKFKTFISTLK